MEKLLEEFEELMFVCKLLGAESFFLRVSEISYTFMMHSNTGRSDYYCSKVATALGCVSFHEYKPCVHFVDAKEIGNWCISDF